MSLIVDGTTGVTFNDSSLQGAAASPYGLKNRIINGDMRIDQRNAGASVTATGTGGSLFYTVDRFAYQISQASKFTVQQNAASVTPPTGFTNYLGITSSSSYSSLATDYFAIMHTIEGYNISDFAWGTANAKTVTLSFQVRSSLTGTFSGTLLNAGANRTYPFTYTISAANTWTTISITISGETTGTWNTTSALGLYLIFDIGSGSNFKTSSSNTWSSSGFYGVTGSQSVVGTNGATFYITGVQLEQNTSATPFERRLYGQELANCQRYYETGYFAGTAPANGAIGYFDGGSLATVAYATNTLRSMPFQFCVEKRTTPAITLYNTGIGGITANFWAYYNGAWANYNSASGISQPTPKSFSVRSTSTSSTGVAYMIEGNWAASAEL